MNPEVDISLICPYKHCRLSAAFFLKNPDKPELNIDPPKAERYVVSLPAFVATSAE